MKTNRLMKYIYLLSLLVLWSCNISKESADNSKILFQADIASKGSLNDSTLFKSSRIILLETNDNSLIRSIDRICYDENRLFVFDRSLKKVVVFDTSGKYLNHIQRIGQGPAEYQSVTDFCIDTNKDLIYVLCGGPYKIMIFDYSGKFIKEKNTGELYINITFDSNYIYCNRSEMASDLKSDFEIACFTPDLEKKKSYLPLRTNINTYRYYYGSKMATSLNSYYARRFDNIIYQLTPDKEIAKYTIDFGKNAIPESMLDNPDNNLVQQAQDKKLVYSITDIAESKKFLIFRTNIGIYAYNKITNELNRYETIGIAPVKYSTSTYYPLNTSKYLVLGIQPMIIKQVKEYIKRNKNSNNSELSKLVEKINDEDNPILILNEFK